MKDDSWIEVAYLSRSNEETFISIVSRPLYALVAEQAGEMLTAVTGHVFCCHIPEWAFEIRWGKVDENAEDDYTPRNLGHLMWNAGQWLSSGFGTWRQEKQIARIPVSRDWVLQHYPDADPIFLGDSGDTMRSAPSDPGEVQF